MPAPSSLAELQDFEKQWDAALSLALAPMLAAPFGFTHFPQESTDEETVPRVETTFSLGAPAGPGQQIQQRGAPAVTLATAWNFSLQFRFVYDPRRLNASALGLRGAFRALMAPESGAFDHPTVMPWLAVQAMNEVRADRAILTGAEGEKGYVVWGTMWEGQFAISPAALAAI